MGRGFFFTYSVCNAVCDSIPATMHRPMSLSHSGTRRTIRTIEAMGLRCTRTNAGTGDYRIFDQTADGTRANVRYASTDVQAIAVARRMIVERIKP